MCASSSTPKIPAATEPKVRSRSAVKRRRDLRLERHGRPAASRALQCRLADQHGGDRRGVEGIHRQVAGQMRQAVLDLGIDVAGDRAVGDLALRCWRRPARPLAKSTLGGQRHRRAHAHAGEAHACGHQPWLQIGGLDAARCLGRWLRRRRRADRPRSPPACRAAVKSSADFSPLAMRALRGERRLAAAGDAERQRRQPVKRHQRAGIRVFGREVEFHRRLVHRARGSVPDIVRANLLPPAVPLALMATPLLPSSLRTAVPTKSISASSNRPG